jgi:hypothetical protein
MPDWDKLNTAPDKEEDDGREAQFVKGWPA